MVLSLTSWQVQHPGLAQTPVEEEVCYLNFPVLLLMAEVSGPELPHLESGAVRVGVPKEHAWPQKV